MYASAHVYTSHGRYDSAGSTQEMQFQANRTRRYGKPTSSTPTLVPCPASLAPGGAAGMHLTQIPLVGSTWKPGAHAVIVSL